MRAGAGLTFVSAVMALPVGAGMPEVVAPLAAVAALAAALAAVRRAPNWLPACAALGGFVSVLCTAGTVGLGWAPLPPWGLLELPVLCVLVGLVTRFGADRRLAVAGVVLAGLGAASSVVRFAIGTLTPLGAGFGVGLWLLAPIAAALIGWYLRHQHQIRLAAIVAARHQQRLELARDLHDYVAHDVTDMIAGLHAVQLVASQDAATVALLARVQAAGRRAMSSLDRTVGLLRDPDATDDRSQAHPPDGLEELGALIERFAATGDVRICLDVHPDLPAHIPPEIGSTAHRVVVEALTNVRRHAPCATQVDVRAVRHGDEMEVSVRNDTGGAAPWVDRRKASGLGLPGLTERVEALGGVLTAGPREDGWLLVARFPLPPTGSVPA